MIPVITTEFWCLLKQHVLTHMDHLWAKYFYQMITHWDVHGKDW